MIRTDAPPLNASSQTPGNSQPASWRFAERILFRFSFCYIVLYYSPTLLELLPGVRLLFAWAYHSWKQLIYLMVGGASPSQWTGSGDTLAAYISQVVVLILAFAAGFTWSLLDRHRTSYIRLHGWLKVLARYALAFTLLAYAFAKLLPIQFPHLQNSRLAESYGQSSPMGLLWRFMGFSPAYTAFAGFSELLPAIFLFFRRTALLGSLLSFVVMLNIVMLNFCYDVPVKLYSLNLLALATFLIAPEARRLSRIFLLNALVQPSDLSEPAFQRPSTARVALVVKFAVLTAALGWSIFSSITSYRTSKAITAQPSYPLTTRGFHWIQEYPYNR
jgi:hypothetical protein